MSQLIRSELISPYQETTLKAKLQRWLRKILGIESLATEIGGSFCRSVELTVWPLEVKVKELQAQLDKFEKKQEVKSKLTKIDGGKCLPPEVA